MADVPDRFKVDFTGETLLGTYLVSEKLAEGGMGSIYLAEDTNLGRRVAVKVPHPRFLGEPGFRERFAREISELVRLEHPHIVRILARGEQDQIPFFVLQFLGGGSLEDRMKALPGAGMSGDAMMSWLQPMAETLDFVHQRGIVHRDVKPANILFDEEGHVFLSDFGVAKVLSAESVDLTGTGTGIGSPLYLAPEQGMGKEVGGAADQYSLATAVYHALSGELPFALTGGLAALVQKTNEDPNPISEVLPDLPAQAAAVVMRALSRDPSARFDRCVEFAEALQEALRPAPVAAPAPSPKAHNWMLIATIGVLACVLLVVAGAWLNRPDEQQPARAPIPDLTDRPMVFLSDPGAKPRHKLRYSARPGALGTYESGTAVKGGFTFDGKETRMPDRGGRPFKFVYDLTVSEVGETGEMTIHWTLPGSVFGLPGNAAGSALIELMCRIDSRGMGGDIELENPDRYPENLARLLDDMGASLHHYVTVLPEEEVGVGARWEVTDRISQFQMRMTGTTTYEILEIDGDRVLLKSAIALTTPAQKMTMPGSTTGQQMNLKSFHSNGEGEIQLDLRRPFPDRYEMSTGLQLLAEVEGEDTNSLMEMDFTAETLVQRK